MSVKIGIDLSRNKERRPGQIGGGIWLFQLMNLRDGGRGMLMIVGTLNLRRDDLVRLRESGRVIDVVVYGLLSFAADVTPSLVKDTIHSVTTFGKLKATPEVKAALAAR